MYILIFLSLIFLTHHYASLKEVTKLINSKSEHIKLRYLFNCLSSVDVRSLIVTIKWS
jgi:hypothetical protein